MRELTPNEKRELLEYKKDDYTAKKLKDLFAVRSGQNEPRFNPNDYFTLYKGEYYNKETIKTTIGRYVVNFLVFPNAFLEKFGYVNTPLTTDELDGIEKKLGNMLLNDEILPQDYCDYLNYGEFVGMGMAFYMLPSMNYEMNKPIASVIKKRDELFNQYKEDIEAGDSNVVDKVESELLKDAKAYLIKSGNPSYDFYASGEFKFSNNYKKSSICGGAFIHPSTKKITVSKSNYMDGITVKDYPVFSNLVVAGGYARGVSTQDGGYETKKLNSAMQAVTLDEAVVDCGTKLTNNFVMPDDKKIYTLFINRYIVENGKLVLLTEQNIKNYAGKEVKLRSPLYCKGDNICRTCAGELFYKLGMPNAGLLTSTFSGTLMNKSMKTIHDASIKFSKIDFSKYIKER